MEEEIEHLKDLKLELDNMSITGPTSEDRLNTHRKSLAISNILNELEKSKDKLTLIAEVCVDECKLHIESSDAIKEIRKILQG